MVPLGGVVEGSEAHRHRQSLSLLDAQSLSKRLLIAVGCLYEEIKLHQAIPNGSLGTTSPGKDARSHFTLRWPLAAGNLEPRISRPRHRHGRKYDSFAFPASPPNGHQRSEGADLT